jgi:hypothetical protein
MSFLPNGYKPQESESSNKYMKLKNGDNLVRILSAPIIGFIGWRDKQPHRAKKIEDLIGEFDNKPKEFWAVVCYSYDNQTICIWEITQKTILKAITNLANEKAWGSPLKYDLKVIRTGEDLQTEYQVSPYPHRETPDKVKSALNSVKINLNALFNNENPFEENKEADIMDSSNDLPF